MPKTQSKKLKNLKNTKKIPKQLLKDLKDTFNALSKGKSLKITVGGIVLETYVNWEQEDYADCYVEKVYLENIENERDKLLKMLTENIIGIGETLADFAMQTEDYKKFDQEIKSYCQLTQGLEKIYDDFYFDRDIL